MTSYAIALDKEIAMLNEKMSKLQKEKKEEETLKEKEIQKEEDNKKRKEEMSKEFAEYDDMMIIQKIYPKFFTITATLDRHSGKLIGRSSPSYIYHDIITNDTVDLDLNVSVFIDNNPQYRVTPIHVNKYMFQICSCCDKEFDTEYVNCKMSKSQKQKEEEENNEEKQKKEEERSKKSLSKKKREGRKRRSLAEISDSSDSDSSC